MTRDLLMRTALVLGLWALGTAGCSSPPAVEGPFNVVIYLIDTLRADRLGVYGYEKPTSPRIDALAAESVLFERADAPAPWTLPAVVSLATSTFPCEHGVLIDGQRLRPQLTPLAERLGGLGYATVSLTSNAYAGPMSGLHRGYDAIRVFGKEGPDLRLLEAWLNQVRDRPFLVYFHTTEPHNPFRPGPERIELFGQVTRQMQREVNGKFAGYRGRTKVDFKAGRVPGTTDNTEVQQRVMAELEERKTTVDALYDAAVRQADDNVGHLIDLLIARGLWEQTLFILLSDHGEELGDHGGWQHDQSVYDELVHVPLLIRFPGAAHAGTRVQTPVSLVDVLPTVADYLGKPGMAAGSRGMSLMQLLDGDAETAGMRVTATRHNRKKYFRPYKELRGDDNVVVRDGTWKAIWNREPRTVELYDLAADPGERADLNGEFADRAEQMEGLARRWLGNCASGATPGAAGTDALDEATRESLRSLGYVD